LEEVYPGYELLSEPIRTLIKKQSRNYLLSQKHENTEDLLTKVDVQIPRQNQVPLLGVPDYLVENFKEEAKKWIAKYRFQIDDLNSDEDVEIIDPTTKNPYMGDFIDDGNGSSDISVNRRLALRKSKKTDWRT
jgi:hypothetical protein